MTHLTARGGRRAFEAARKIGFARRRLAFPKPVGETGGLKSEVPGARRALPAPAGRRIIATLRGCASLRLWG